MISLGRHAAVVPVFVLALTAAGCLTASQESRVQTDLDQVRKQVFEMQRDTAAMMSKMTSIEEKLAKQDSAQPTRWADLQALLQTLADGVRTLGARLDDNTTRMGSLARDIAATRDQYRALEARIASALGERPPSQPLAAAPPPSALEPPNGGSSGAPPNGGSPVVAPNSGSQGAPPQAGAQNGTPAGGSQPGSIVGGPRNTPIPASSQSGSLPGARPTGALTSGAPTNAGSAPPLHGAVDQASLSADESAQEELFRSAYSDYTRGNYEAALTGFQGFLARYPSSALAAGALYDSGDCLFNLQRYQEAADAFGKAVADHPNMDNAAASYLKRGLSLLALKQTAQGVVQLQHVIDSYPRSEEARIAADRLRQLGLRDR